MLQREAERRADVRIQQPQALSVHVDNPFADAQSQACSLSGGMRRRIAFARALAYQGDLLLLDEPFKGMDLALVERLAPLLQNLTIPVILSTHSPEEQEVIGGTILEMDKL